MTSPDFQHQPVLCAEVLAALHIRPHGCYVDATFGRGGHTRAILARLAAEGRVLALDQDPVAVAAAAALAAEDERLQVVQANFSQLTAVVAEAGLTGKVHGVLLDLGVSSPQLDDAARGFSFLHDGPLDMRMNPTQGESAQTWLAHAKEREIAEVLRGYGEERYAKRIARAIVAARHQQPLTGTRQLAEIISAAHPAWEPHKHPATRSFQAIRIFLNRELEVLESVLPQTLAVLAPGGRLAVISFHSLEDRGVKRFIRDQARGGDFPPDLPVTAAQFHPTLKPVGKAVSASPAETDANPRARSAVLRVAERVKG